jgi:hypothetical protein
MILWELERVESFTRKHVPATPPCKETHTFVSNAHITMFTLFKVFMAKCILITFLYQSNKQSSKYQDGKMAKYPSKIVMA